MQKFTFVLAALVFVALLVCPARQASAGDVQCTIKLEACGSLEQKLSPLTKVKEGVCLKVDVATFGKKPSSPYYAANVWVGVSVSGDTLVVGKGEVKTGAVLECAWDLSTPKPKDQLESLKKALPQLLKDERFARQFPGVKKIDASALTTIEPADKKCTDAIAELSKRK